MFTIASTKIIFYLLKKVTCAYYAQRDEADQD